NSGESQQLRFTQLLRVCDLSSQFSINDYGCGYGALAGFLQDLDAPFEYRGFDISPPMIECARFLHVATNNCRFVATESELPVSDYTVASGIFNVKLDTPTREWASYIVNCISRFATLSSRGFAFNALSSYSDPGRTRDDLYYANPAFWFDYCKTT